MNRTVEQGAKALAAIGALNWGLAKFVNLDLITKLPSGIFQTLAYGLVAASGAYALYLMVQRKV